MVSQITCQLGKGMHERSRHSGKDQPHGGGMADSHFCNVTLRLVSPQGKLGWWRTATLPCCHTHGDRTRCASCACSGLCFCVPSHPPWEGSAAARARAFNFHSILWLQQIEAISSVLR